MSLRRRIAAAAAVAVAAVAIAVAVISYVSTRSHLIGEVKSELVSRAQGFLGHHGPRGGAPGGQHGPPEIPEQPLGGARGYFQVVNPNGTVATGGQLPVTGRVVGLARTGGGFFSDTHVNGTHAEIYSVWDPPDQHIVQVALPLTSEDAVLNGLLLPYGLLIGVGVAIAALLGLAISRTALRPIDRFVAKTERVTSELEHPARLEEADAVELRRLGRAFNQTLEALERSIAAQRALVADASHELRTPIAALRSNIQIFLDSGRLPREEREGLRESILAELDELTQIVSDVLELARGSAPTSRAEPVELDTLVREAIERAERRAPELRFELEIEPSLLTGDPDRIGRAISNVIDNARKWSRGDGVVEVSLRNGTLTVRDHGPGFPEADLARVFDRFYRAETARRMPGSGLGLAIVKQAAEAHGGWARAENAPEGGARVTLHFPAVEVAEVAGS